MQTNLPTQIACAGLPQPAYEYQFHIERKWCFDLAWLDRYVAVEIEGGTFLKGGGRHNRAKGFRNDIDKYNAATLLGWRVFRVTTAMVADGSALAVVAEALHAYQPC